MSNQMMEFILTFGTLGFGLAFAYVNIRQTERQLRETRERRQREALRSTPAPTPMVAPTAMAAE